jgi:hypothetical protein
MDISTQADALNKALEDDIPKMKPAPQPVVELIRGILNKETDVWETSALVRELNGFDEEAIASIDSRKMVYPEFMSFLLKRAVVKIGTIEVSENPAVIDQLIIGDRDLLFLGVIEATYGKTREYQVTCRACNSSNDVFVSMDEFKRKEATFNVRENLTVELSNGTSVSLRLPVGFDSQHVAKKAKTTAEQNTLMISRCIVGVSNPEEWSRNLNLKDRALVIKTLMDNQPGPEIGEVNAQCATCGEDLNLVLDWASLLFS